MSRILVIPDSHLKPSMFDEAERILAGGEADFAVCLMDLVDNWGQQDNLELYAEMFRVVMAFQKNHPGTLWCWGNHDLSYLWARRKSGIGSPVFRLVSVRLGELKDMIPEGNLVFLHRVDKLIFSHAGLTEDFVARFVPAGKQDSIDETIAAVNEFGPDEIWTEDSPVFARPQFRKTAMFMGGQYVQVVGHTPGKEVFEDDGVISTDVYKTNSGGEPIGNRKMIIIDSETTEWHYSRIYDR